MTLVLAKRDPRLRLPSSNRRSSCWPVLIWMVVTFFIFEEAAV